MLKGFSHYVVHSLFGVQPVSRLADAAELFVYDIRKIFLLLSVIIFIVSIMRSYFSPERTKRILSHKKEFIGNVLAILGIVNGKIKHSGKPLPSLYKVKELIKAEA